MMIQFIFLTIFIYLLVQNSFSQTNDKLEFAFVTWIQQEYKDTMHAVSDKQIKKINMSNRLIGKLPKVGSPKGTWTRLNPGNTSKEF